MKQKEQINCERMKKIKVRISEHSRVFVLSVHYKLFTHNL